MSTDPIKGANGFEGSKSIFAFEDINQVQISQGPGMTDDDQRSAQTFTAAQAEGARGLQRPRDRVATRSMLGLGLVPGYL